MSEPPASDARARSGLVFCYLLREGKSIPADWDRVNGWTPDQGILWTHLDYSNEAARGWLLERSGLDPVSCEALLAEESRPRIVSTPRSLLLILRGINCNPGSDPEDMVSLRMWFDETRVISMRHRRIMAMEDINRTFEAGAGPRSVNEFVVMVARRLADRIGNVIAKIDDDVDELEDQVLTSDSRALRPALAGLRRKTISLRRYISPQRDVLSQLQNERIAWLTDLDRVHIREIAERTARFVDDLDSARDRAAITQEELNSHLSERMNKTMYVLSLISAIFLPLGLITGLLGINVGGIPGTENGSAFVIVCVLLAVFGLIQFLIFRKKGWL